MKWREYETYLLMYMVRHSKSKTAEKMLPYITLSLHENETVVEMIVQVTSLRNFSQLKCTLRCTQLHSLSSWLHVTTNKFMLANGVHPYKFATNEFKNSRPILDVQHYLWEVSIFPKLTNHNWSQGGITWRWNPKIEK